MENRECKIIFRAADQGCGKSNESLKMILKSVTGDANTPPRKAIIFDTNGEFGDYKVFKDNGTCEVINIKTLPITKIIEFSIHPKIEARRIVPINEYGMPLEPEMVEKLLINMVTYFRGGTVLIEDLNKIYGDSFPKSFGGFLTNKRHRDTDIIIHIQSIARMLPKLWQTVNFVGFHHQIDMVENSRTKLKENFELFKIAQLIIDNEYFRGKEHERFWLWVDLNKHKIRRATTHKLTIEMISAAVSEYLMMYDMRVKMLMKQRDIKNKSLFSYEKAMIKAKDELINKYF